MSVKKSIALVGDYSPEVTAHRAIPDALKLAGEAIGKPVHPSIMLPGRGDWQHYIYARFTPEVYFRR